MTIKEYSKSRGVTYEATRQMINRHADELEGHITAPGNRQGRQLDDVAVELLDGWRAINPLVVLSADRDEELEQLRAENKTLMTQVIALQEQLLKERSEASALAGRVEVLESALPAAATETPNKKWWQKLLG